MVYCRYEQQCQLLGMPATSLQWAWLQPREQHQGSLPALQAVEHCKVLEVRYHAFYSEEVNPVEWSMSCLTAWWSLAPLMLHSMVLSVPCLFGVLPVHVMLACPANTQHSCREQLPLCPARHAHLAQQLPRSSTLVASMAV